MAFENLSKETLSKLGYLNGDNPQQKGEEKKRKKKTLIDLYDEEDTFNTSAIKIKNTTMKDINIFVSSKFRQIFHGYRGSKFQFGQNGFIEFVLIFDLQPGDPGDKIECVVPFNNNPNMSDTQQFIENIRRNKNGRRTMTLTQECKDILEQFMVRPIEHRDGMNVLKEVNWNDCVTEYESNTSEYIYSTPKTESVLIVRNVDLEKILNNMLTPTSVKNKDIEAAIKRYDNRHRNDPKKYRTVKRETVDPTTGNKVVQEVQEEIKLSREEKLALVEIEPSIIHKVNFRGYYQTNAVNMINVSTTFNQMSPDGGIYKTPFLNSEYFSVNIETINVEQIMKSNPTQRIMSNQGYLSDVY